MNLAEMDDELKRLEARVTLALAKAAAISGSGTSGGLTPPANGSWAQPAWFINPATGLDTNNGITAGTPLKTWRQLVALFGTTAPILGQSTTITFQGLGHIDNSDPVIFAPRIKNGSTIQIVGSLNAAVWTGTLAGVTAKNRATPQILLATLPAGAAATQLIVNTTHPSRAYVYKASGGNWLITQPMLNPAAPFAMRTAPAEVNSWANLDAVSGFVPTQINLVELEPLVMDESVAQTAALYVQQCVAFEPFPGRGDSLQANQSVIFVDVLLQKQTVVNATNGLDATPVVNSVGCSNCNSTGGFAGGAPGGTLTWLFLGGQVAGFGGAACTLDADAIVSATSNVGGSAGGALLGLGLVCFDTGANLNVSTGATCIVQNGLGFGAPILWGAGGVIDIQGTGHMQYPTGGVATTTFIQTPASPFIQLNGVTTGHSVTAGSPDVFNGAITTTTAHLDAAVGAAGFGGNAFNPGNASISNLNL